MPGSYRSISSIWRSLSASSLFFCSEKCLSQLASLPTLCLPCVLVFQCNAVGMGAIDSLLLAPDSGAQLRLGDRMKAWIRCAPPQPPCGVRTVSDEGCFLQARTRKVG